MSLSWGARSDLSVAVNYITAGGVLGFDRAPWRAARCRDSPDDSLGRIRCARDSRVPLPRRGARLRERLGRRADPRIDPEPRARHAAHVRRGVHRADSARLGRPPDRAPKPRPPCQDPGDPRPPERRPDRRRRRARRKSAHLRGVRAQPGAAGPAPRPGGFGGGTALGRRAEGRRLGEWFGAFYGRRELAAEVSVWGEPQECVERLSEIVAAGVGFLMLNPVFDELEQLELFASALRPKL